MSAPDSLGHKLFVTSKPWVQDTGCERTRQAIAQSLRCLQLDYLDLFLIHQPFGDVHGSWRAMQDAYRSGKLRAIGVSNFQHDRLMDIIAFNDIAPAVNQIEVNPFHQQAVGVAFMFEHGRHRPPGSGHQQLLFPPRPRHRAMDGGTQTRDSKESQAVQLYHHEPAAK